MSSETNKNRINMDVNISRPYTEKELELIKKYEMTNKIKKYPLSDDLEKLFKKDKK